MSSPVLESISQSPNYGDLPETWRVPEIERFSSQKTLYDYQRSAMENAARALFLYYGKEHDWAPGEAESANRERKRAFFNRYNGLHSFHLKRYESRADERSEKESRVFRILSEFITPQDGFIHYQYLINRMCFWMATGSGKTLVMVKLIEYLHALKRHGEIPPHNILILAPSDHLLGQIRRTVEEFNRTGLHIELVPLREHGRVRQGRFGDTEIVYYHRGDNIAGVQKDALTDYRIYENSGRWYVFLDEAHKGGKEDSKRQAYYAVMAREGFLFNFSATFTDKEDIATTVKKYNLEEFIKEGHGKSIYLNEMEYSAFKGGREEISHGERRKIVLKSLVTLAYVLLRVKWLRSETKLENLYHSPLMLTLVNSVNTDVENEKNDLWAFFQTLREIATGEIAPSFFKDARDELISDWGNAQLLFGMDGDGIIGTDDTSIKDMKVTDLREAVFGSRRKSALQFIRSSDNKELAFQMKNADAPFALIRIGDTSRWRNQLLAGYEETTALQTRSFFDDLEQSPITILMGSRSFFESWDSNRPNVINFINIGVGKGAQKFVVQSVGRGVRIEPLPNQRRRFARLPNSSEKRKIQRCHDMVQPPETLFLFATNRNAVKAVFEGLEAEQSLVFEKLRGFARTPVPKIRGRKMPLLIPEYRDAPEGFRRMPFSMSGETRQRFQQWLQRTSDSVFAVRDGLVVNQIGALRGVAEMSDGIQIDEERNYARLRFLQSRLLSHLSRKVKMSGGVREIKEEDIVHFREIRVQAERRRTLEDAVNRVRQGKPSKEQIAAWNKELQEGRMTTEAFQQRCSGTKEEAHDGLTIKKLLNHYYLPVILGDEKADYIRHIITVDSEVKFLNELEGWIGSNRVAWDAWMFSKLDESLDRIYIPYYDKARNEYRNFKPDFIFWMCRGDNYRIVFADPKGAVHTDAYHKIDGYQKLFEHNRNVRQFRYKNRWQVSVSLLMFNPEPDKAPELYKAYWSKQPGDIFRAA